MESNRDIEFVSFLLNQGFTHTEVTRIIEAKRAMVQRRQTLECKKSAIQKIQQLHHVTLDETMKHHLESLDMSFIQMLLDDYDLLERYLGMYIKT